MIISKIRLPLFYLLLLFVFSCDDGFEKPPSNLSDLWDCHHMSVWNELSTREALIGIWEWEFVSCPSGGDAGIYVSDRNVAIEFKPDNTLIVWTKDSITQVATWHVEDGDGDLFQLEVEPGVDQLWGRILFCDDRVLFNYSYIDICDNYFIERE